MVMPAAGGTSAGDPFLFSLALKQRGLEIREQEGDGNCLFRAVSLQVYGDASMHGQVRKQCMDFMVRPISPGSIFLGDAVVLIPSRPISQERGTEHFSQFVTGEKFSMYIRRKRREGVHGNNLEIQAISELFNRPIEVFSPENGSAPLNIFHAEYKTDDAPIRLSYHDGNHYNAVIDPLVPTAGLGLGLPGLQPGLADKLQMAKAVAESDATADEMELARALKESDDDELQRALKESQLSTEHVRVMMLSGYRMCWCHVC
jgi:OTU domain-containing protein 5